MSSAAAAMSPRSGVSSDASDRVGAAAVGECETDLPVADRDHREQQRDRDRDLDRGEQCRGPGEDQHPQDLLGCVGRRADRVRAEDRQRLLLGQALADLLVDGERPPEQQRASRAMPRPTWVRGRRRGLLGDEVALARVPEVGGVGPLDANAPVAKLAALERARLSRLIHSGRGIVALRSGAHAGVGTRPTMRAWPVPIDARSSVQPWWRSGRSRSRRSWSASCRTCWASRTRPWSTCSRWSRRRSLPAPPARSSSRSPRSCSTTSCSSNRATRSPSPSRGEWVAVLLLLFVGVVVGQLAALQRTRTQVARDREREARALFRAQPRARDP